MSTENPLPTAPGYYLDNADDVWGIREPGDDLRWLGDGYFLSPGEDALDPESWKPFTRLVPLSEADLKRILHWLAVYDDQVGYKPEDLELEKRLTGE